MIKEYSHPSSDKGIMLMVKIKPLEEITRRYAESALVSAVRLRRHWMSQGLSEKEAIKRAVKQASGMMASSGIPLEQLYNLFDELEKACTSFKKTIIIALKETKTKRK